MNITVSMTAEEFLEFVAWGKDRDYYKSRLAKRLGRDFIGCEINPDYAQMAAERIKRTM